MKVNMENIFDFETQICTNRQQSEKLLGLGLKKEMADCYLYKQDQRLNIMQN